MLATRQIDLYCGKNYLLILCVFSIIVLVVLYCSTCASSFALTPAASKSGALDQSHVIEFLSRIYRQN